MFRLSVLIYSPKLDRGSVWRSVKTQNRKLQPRQFFGKWHVSVWNVPTRNSEDVAITLFLHPLLRFDIWKPPQIHAHVLKCSLLRLICLPRFVWTHPQGYSRDERSINIPAAGESSTDNWGCLLLPYGVENPSEKVLLRKAHSIWRHRHMKTSFTYLVCLRYRYRDVDRTIDLEEIQFLSQPSVWISNGWGELCNTSFTTWGSWQLKQVKPVSKSKQITKNYKCFCTSLRPLSHPAVH